MNDGEEIKLITPTKENLVSLAAECDKRGWKVIAGHFKGENDTCYCLIGGIVAAQGEDPTQRIGIDQWDNVHGWLSVTRFNDNYVKRRNPQATFTEVAAAFVKEVLT